MNNMVFHYVPVPVSKIMKLSMFMMGCANDRPLEYGSSVTLAVLCKGVAILGIKSTKMGEGSKFMQHPFSCSMGFWNQTKKRVCFPCEEALVIECLLVLGIEGTFGSTHQKKLASASVALRS